MRIEGLLVLTVIIHCVVGPPVTTKKPGPDPKERVGDDDQFGLEYERYLKEIVSVLESDESFRKKLEESNVTDIKSGEIARHLEFVNHNVRSKLDEIKRKEIDRLRSALKIQNQLHRAMAERGGANLNNLPRLDKNRILGHLDHNNPNSFEVEDLSILIQQATSDLEDIDKQRRQDFKHYEMEKEVEQQHNIEKLKVEEREIEVQRLEELKRKHADHPKLHHPGGKDQLEEVWEESDGLEKEDFNPKTFFKMHDVNGDDVLDEVEVEALFQKELDKVYNPDNPEEDDPVERFEEMNRMREHVFTEVDKNRDKQISLQEFLESTKGEQFEKDEGWETLEENKAYTDEELEQFVKEYEIRQREALDSQGHQLPVDPSHVPPMGQDPAQGVVHMEQGPRHGQDVVMQEVDVDLQDQGQYEGDQQQDLGHLDQQQDLGHLDQQQELPQQQQQFDQQQQPHQQQKQFNQQHKIIQHQQQQQQPLDDAPQRLIVDVPPQQQFDQQQQQPQPAQEDTQQLDRQQLDRQQQPVQANLVNAENRPQRIIRNTDPHGD